MYIDAETMVIIVFLIVGLFLLLWSESNNNTEFLKILGKIAISTVVFSLIFWIVSEIISVL